MLSEAERDVMNHALGNDVTLRPGRNYFAAEVGSDDYRTWVALTERGLARNHGKISFAPDTFFSVTEAGRKALETTDG